MFFANAGKRYVLASDMGWCCYVASTWRWACSIGASMQYAPALLPATNARSLQRSATRDAKRGPNSVQPGNMRFKAVAQPSWV